jgi:hypothetical protein
VRIGRNSRTLYLLDVGGSKFEVRFKGRETEGSKRFEDAVQRRLKAAKINVLVGDRTGVGDTIEEQRGRIPAGLSVCEELLAGFEITTSAVY